MVRSILVFYRNLHEKAAGLLRQSSLRSGSVYVDGLGVQEKMEPCFIHRAQGTDGYLLMCFYDPVTILDQTGTKTYPPGRLVFWHPEDPHYYGNEDLPWNHSWIHLCGKDVATLLEKNPIPRNEVLPFSYSGFFDEALLGIYEELEGLWPADGVLIGNLVENLFRRVLRALFNDPAESPVPERLRAVKRHLDTHYNQPSTLDELAHLAHLSVSHLSAEFRACFGLPPIEYRTRLRMQHACRFLKDTNLRVSEIASLVGYPDVFYFSKHFKTFHGVSPREFRKNAARITVA
jgi:AraC-like DNA-binding protein